MSPGRAAVVDIIRCGGGGLAQWSGVVYRTWRGVLHTSSLSGHVGWKYLYQYVSTLLTYFTHCVFLLRISCLCLLSNEFLTYKLLRYFMPQNFVNMLMYHCPLLSEVNKLTYNFVGSFQLILAFHSMTCTGGCGYKFSTPDERCCDTRNM